MGGYSFPCVLGAKIKPFYECLIFSLIISAVTYTIGELMKDFVIAIANDYTNRASTRITLAPSVCIKAHVINVR